MPDTLRQIIDLTRKLMGFVTTHDRPDQIRRCCLFVSDWLRDQGIDHRCQEHGDYLSIVVLPPANHAPVLLMSHLDVVAASPKLFTPRIEGDILWGRGSIDDKYAVALSLVLLKDFLAAGGECPFGLLITSDEEIGGAQGAGKILPSISTDFGIALDGGDPDHIVIKEKGILKIRLTAQGKSAHGSRPWLGKNAITLLAADILALEKLFEPGSNVQGHWHRTCNPGIIKGGRAANQVPDRAEAILDVRYTEKDDPRQLMAEMAAVVQGSLHVEEHASMLLSGKSRYIDLLMECCPGASLVAEHGSSDARYLSQLGIDAVVWGADGQMSQHSDKEHVLIPSIGLLYERLAGFIRKVSENASQ